MKRSQTKRQGQKAAGSGERILTVRLPLETYLFMLEESAELALARGENPRAVAAEKADVQGLLANGKGKSRGLLVFADVIGNAIDVLRTYGGLPDLVQARLERDRADLAARTRTRYSRFRYLQHVLYARSEQVVKNGPAFDAEFVQTGGLVGPEAEPQGAARPAGRGRR